MGRNRRSKKQQTKGGPLPALGPVKTQQAMVVQAMKRKELQNRRQARLNAKVLKQEVHGLGSDTRSDNSSMVKKDDSIINDPTSNGVVKQVVTCQVSAIESMAAGIVAYAMRKGWQGTSVDQSATSDVWPYYAYVRIVQIVIGFMLGSTPVLTQAPVWFWTMIHAIKPKVGQMRTGRVSYSWNVKNNNTPVAEDYVAPATINIVTKYNIIFGGPDGTTFAGFPGIVAAGGYSVNEGSTALQAMFQVWSNDRLIGDPGDKVAVTGRDSSSFAANYPELGVSGMGPTAFTTTIYNETFIRAPLFSKFAEWQPSTTRIWRGWNETRVSAGSGAYILTRLSELPVQSQAINKQRPRFKTYNFDEFFDVLARIVGMGMEIAGQGTQNVIKTCTLTPWQVQLILRQTLLQVFENYLAQDLYFGAGIDGQTVPWFPFVVSSNGVSLGAGSAQMQLPIVFVECIRACARQTAKVSAARAGFDQISDAISILGRYDPESMPMLGNYTYDLNGNPALVFAPETLSAFNIIDLSYPDGGTKYFTCNGEQFGILVEAWNEWIKPLSSYLVALASITSEKCISALGTVTMTNHLTYVPPLQQTTTNTTNITNSSAAAGPTVIVSVQKEKMERKTSVRRIQTKGMSRVVKQVLPEGGANYFDNMQIRVTTSTYPFLSATSKYLNAFILPCQTAFAVADQENTPSSVQTFQMEPYSRADYSSSQNGLADTKMTLTTRHIILAQMNVKGTFAGKTECEVELEQLAKEGRGSFFTWVARAIQGLTGWNVSKIGEGIDEALGT